MFLCVWMTTHGSLGSSSLGKRQILPKFVELYACSSNVNKEKTISTYKVIMERNLKMQLLTSFVPQKGLFMSSLLLLPLSRMRLLNEKIECYKKWLEPCSMLRRFQFTSRQKP